MINCALPLQSCGRGDLSSRSAALGDAPADVSLLMRIVNREPAALAELYDRHSRVLFGLILRIVSDRGEAEEVLGELWTEEGATVLLVVPPEDYMDFGPSGAGDVPS